MVWVEYGSQTLKVAGGVLGGWELVTFKKGPGRGASWRQMTPENWAEPGVTEPPPGPDDVQLRG